MVETLERESHRPIGDRREALADAAARASRAARRLDAEIDEAEERDRIRIRETREQIERELAATRARLERLAELKSNAEAEQRVKALERRQEGFSLAGRPRPDAEMGHSRLVAEAWASGAAVILTLLAFAAYVTIFAASLEDRVTSPMAFAPALVYLFVVSFLIYGAIVYLLSRLGYMRRRARFRHARDDELRDFAARTDARVTVLVPSYKEEPDVVRRALLSAALQEYPHRRVVLLIDDPPSPSSTHDARLLDAARRLPVEINALLARTRRPFAQAARRAELHALRGELDRRAAAAELASLYARAAAWFRVKAAVRDLDDHAEALFVELSLREPARRHSARAKELQELIARGESPSEGEILASYRELRALFTVQVTSFERKRWANLSHAPNKAMNLNSYISLMGYRFAEAPGADGLAIHEVPPTAPGFDVPDADYVLTLDADSLLDPRYAARLVHFLDRKENSRFAIAQTPYSAIPGAARSIEKIAGATTDIQYVMHQGFTAHGATYWVGANALLRKQALDDIGTHIRDQSTGANLIRYIQDRTVIEDTESSVDFVHQGWRLFNYPARLSYSATPPDFGSLVVQRRRWANGGLLILPKLLRSILRGADRPGPIHAFMRFHYLVSITTVNVGLVVLLFVPFANWYVNVCLPLTATPYFALYAHDLRLAGYRARDVVKVYALNLILVPVNLGGVARSLWQAITGRRTPFLRTPKVRDRTTAPALYVALPYLLIVMLLSGGVFSLVDGELVAAGAAGVNALLVFYGVGAFIGWRDSREDLAAQWLAPATGAGRASAAGNSGQAN